MKRRLFTIFSVLSLLMCIATAAIWVRSYWIADHVTDFILHRGDSGFDQICASTVNGSILVGYLDRQGSLPPSEVAGLKYEAVHMRVPRDTPARRWGFGYWDGSKPNVSMICWEVWWPLWVLMLPMAALPGAWLIVRARARERQKRVMRHLCVHCGYDVRASKERCPECGTPIAASAIGEAGV